MIFKCFYNHSFTKSLCKWDALRGLRFPWSFCSCFVPEDRCQEKCDLSSEPDSELAPSAAAAMECGRVRPFCPKIWWPWLPAVGKAVPGGSLRSALCDTEL